jgi:hypothetical protein
MASTQLKQQFCMNLQHSSDNSEFSVRYSAEFAVKMQMPVLPDCCK